MGERQSMVVRITGNIDALKKSLSDGTAVIDGVSVKMRNLAKPTDTLNQSFQKFDSVLASVGINLGTEVKALGELSVAAGDGATKLGGLEKAGLAAGAAFAGWNLGRMVSEFFELDKKIGDVTAQLLGWGDVAGQEAAAGAETLARASKLAGFQITDMDTAIKLLSESVKEHAAALNTSERQVAAWGQEIAKVKGDGNWGQLTADLKSQNFELKELSTRYGISVDAIQYFQTEQKKADDAIVESNKRKIEATKKSAEAQKEAREQAERMAQAVGHLKIAQGDYTSVLAQFDQKLVESIKLYAELGLSVQDMSTLLGVNASQVGLVTEALDKQGQTMDDVTQRTQELRAAQAQACDEMVANAQAAAAAQQKAFEDAVNKIIESQRKMSEGGTRTYDLSTAEGMAEFKRLNPSAFIGNIPPDYFKSHTLQDAIRDGLIDLYAGFKNKGHGFADGVRNFQGGVALVGERGPEIVNLPRGSDVIPNHQLGAMGGVHITVNGFVGSEAQLGQAIGDALMARERSLGTRFSVRR